MYEDYLEPIDNTHGGRKRVDTNISIYMYLWYLANTITFRQLANLFGVCNSSAWKIVVRVSKWIIHISPLYIKWPEPNEMPSVSKRFESIRKIPNIIGAIDVTHIRIRKPVEYGTDYFNKKQYYSLSLQAIVDADKKFIDVYCGEPGSLHDARVLKRSQFYRNVFNDRNNMFHSNNFIIGDSAYPLKDWLITPFKDHGHLTDIQKNFNFIHS